MPTWALKPDDSMHFGYPRPLFHHALNSPVNQMIVLDNTNKGYSLALTAGVQKSFSKNWEAGIAIYLHVGTGSGYRQL